MKKKDITINILLAAIKESTKNEEERLSLRVVEEDHLSPHAPGNTREHDLRLMEGRGFGAKVKGADPQSDLAASIDAESKLSRQWDSWEDSGWEDGWK